MFGRAPQEDLAERWENLYDPLTSTFCRCAQRTGKDTSQRRLEATLRLWATGWQQSNGTGEHIHDEETELGDQDEKASAINSVKSSKKLRDWYSRFGFRQTALPTEGKQ